MTNAILTGLMLGGMYALIAMGLTLQYGVARIMNLSYGEFLIAAAFASHWLFTGWAISPFAGLALVVPLAFVLNFAIYKCCSRRWCAARPTATRWRSTAFSRPSASPSSFRARCSRCSAGPITATRSSPSRCSLLGETVAANRLAALGIAILLGLALYLALTRTRAGTAVRAVAVDPFAAQLVAINVPQASALTFALGGALVAAAGVLVSTFLTFSASSGVVFTMKALIVVVMGGVGNMLGCLVAGLALGLSEALVASYVDPGLTLAVNFALFLAVLLVKPAGLFGRATAMNARTAGIGVVALAALALLAFVPRLGNAYYLALAISLLQYTVLATAWGMFSGPTRYVSLATTAFFGVGAYTVAVLGEVLPWPLVLLIAAALGAIVAAIVGLSTLRLSGVYFVIFTFGLTELIRQLVVWFEVNKSRVLGRYVFVDITQADIYWQLLALTAAVFLLGWLIARSRLGFALRVIGEDETVAKHCGINTTFAKVALFTISATVMTLVGAIMAPRWTYIEPSIAFNSMISFQVLIMALLGGAHRLWGPVLGAVPLTLLFELLSARFPNTFTIILGCIFLLIVYMLPRGVAGLFEKLAATPGGKTTGQVAA